VELKKIQATIKEIEKDVEQIKEAVIGGEEKKG